MSANLHQSPRKKGERHLLARGGWVIGCFAERRDFRGLGMKPFAQLVAAALFAVMGSWAAFADPISDLAGFWSGNGAVTLTSGNTERVKCQVFYKSADGNSQLKQTLRCASADYTINSTAELQVKGGQVTGSWEEKTYAAKGDVTGRYSGENFALMIKGASFTATMNVTLSACKQSINITPKGLEVTKVTIALSKC